ncbi:MAG: tyrosine-type recombinase/integrase, partial [Chloroflexota bacterium]
RCSPHVLRHTFARTFLTNGGDVFSLQRILGHSPASLEITRRYVHLLDDDLRATHRRASPVDHLPGVHVGGDPADEGT